MPIEARRSEIRSAWAGREDDERDQHDAADLRPALRQGWSCGSCSQPNAPAPQKIASSAAGSSR